MSTLASGSGGRWPRHTTCRATGRLRYVRRQSVVRVARPAPSLTRHLLGASGPVGVDARRYSGQREPSTQGHA
jgi:hypothetical protein